MLRRRPLQVLTHIARRGLQASVPYHERAVYIATHQSPEQWPARAEEIPAFSKLLQALNKTGANKGVIFHSGSAYEEGDVLVFPERVLFPKGALKDPEALAHELVNTPKCELKRDQKEGLARKPLEKNRHFIFVCCHSARDMRCRECGVPVLKRLQEWACLRAKPYQPLDAMATNPYPLYSKPFSVQVFPSSHIGGHKHAANLIIHGRGDWFGKVPPQEAVDIVQRYFLTGQRPHHVDYEMWRGRMGLTKTQQEAMSADLEFQYRVEQAGVWAAQRWHEDENAYDFGIQLE